jgi:hypothetical protein
MRKMLNKISLLDAFDHHNPALLILELQIIREIVVVSVKWIAVPYEPISPAITLYIFPWDRLRIPKLF